MEPTTTGKPVSPAPKGGETQSERVARLRRKVYEFQVLNKQHLSVNYTCAKQRNKSHAGPRFAANITNTAPDPTKTDTPADPNRERSATTTAADHQQPQEIRIVGAVELIDSDEPHPEGQEPNFVYHAGLGGNFLDSERMGFSDPRFGSDDVADDGDDDDDGFGPPSEEPSDGLSKAEIRELVSNAGHTLDGKFGAGRWRVPAFEIQTNGQVSHVRQRPTNGTMAAALTKAIKKMADEGVIERAAPGCRYNSQIFLVDAGKDDEGNAKQRAVIDLRLVNANVNPVTFQTENLGDMLQRATAAGGKDRWFAKCDMKSFFWQAPLGEKSRPLTTFTGPDGKTWQHRVLPQGLCSSPALTASAMHELLAPFKDFSCIVVDDISCWGDTKQECKERFFQILKALADAGLQLSINKTEACVRSIIFAGYRIQANSISVAEGKTEMIASWPEPNTAKALASFVFLCRWLSPFVRGFEEHASVLELALKRAKTTIVLAPHEQAAFEHIKSVLSSPHSLATFDQSLPLLLYTDASKTCCGAILVQEFPTGPKVVAYHSKMHSSHETQYAVREQELLCVLQCLKRFHAWVSVATEIVVFSDHESLRYVTSALKQSTERMARWALFMGGFPIRFVYLPGVQNAGADALSRIGQFQRKKVTRTIGAVLRQPAGRLVDAEDEPQQQAGGEDDRYTQHQVDVTTDYDLPVEWQNSLLLGYDSDPWFEGVREILVDPTIADASSSQARSRAKLMRLKDGLLFNTAAENERLAIPAGPVCDRIVEDIHTGLVHPGKHGTACSVRRTFFIPSLDDTVNRIVGNCTECLKNKAKTSATGFTNNETDKTVPLCSWSTVCVDMATGLPDVNGKDAILVMVDELTHRVILEPTSASATADDVIDTLQRSLFRNFGFPQMLRLDKGSQFTSSLFKDFCVKHGMKLAFATTDKHVGPVERTIKTVRERLRIGTERGGQGWLYLLPQIEFALNATPSGDDNVTPFERERGSVPRFPLSPATPGAALDPTSKAEQMNNMQYQLIDSFYAQRERSAAQYDRGRTASKIKIGMKVLVPADLSGLPIHRHGNAKYAKLNEEFAGPFSVIADEGRGNWRLELPGGSKVTPIFHQSKIKATNDFGITAARGLRHEDMFWPDGTRRIKAVLAQRQFFTQKQFLASFVGLEESAALWISLKNYPNDNVLIQAFQPGHNSKRFVDFDLSRPLGPSS
jgi:hypothetical protein